MARLNIAYIVYVVFQFMHAPHITRLMLSREFSGTCRVLLIMGYSSNIISRTIFWLLLVMLIGLGVAIAVALLLGLLFS